MLSVRRFGGGLADAPFVAQFVERVEPRFVAGLEALGAEVRVVDRVDPRNPPSNKLRMLELAASHDFDTLLAIDTDTVVIGDVDRYAVPGAVAVKPENTDPYPPETWRGVYAALGIAEPARSMMTSSTGQLTWPYYNSGVVFVPRDLCGTLRDSWTKRVADVLDLYDRRPDVVPPGRSGTGPTSSRWRWHSPATLCRWTRCRWRRTCRRRCACTRWPTRSRRRSCCTTTTRSTPRASCSGRATAMLNPHLDAINRVRAETFDLAVRRAAVGHHSSAGRCAEVEGHRWYEERAAGRAPAATGCSPRPPAGQAARARRRADDPARPCSRSSSAAAGRGRRWCGRCSTRTPTWPCPTRCRSWSAWPGPTTPCTTAGRGASTLDGRGRSSPPTPRWRRWGLPDESRALPGRPAPVDFPDAVRRVYAATPRTTASGATPTRRRCTSLHLRRLARMFPEARFVHVVRDGRDVALSYTTSPGARPR